MKLCKFPDCEAYTMNEQVDYRGTHLHYLRKSDRDFKKAALKVPPKRPSKFSEKKAAKILPYAILRRNYLNENPVCQIRIDGVCIGPSEEIHHCSMSDLDFLEVSTWKASCVVCHRWVESMMSAEERRAKGLLIDPVNKKFNEPHKI